MSTHRGRRRVFEPQPSTVRHLEPQATPTRTPAISPQDFISQMLASRPQKSNLSQNQIQQIFLDTLKEMGLTINSLALEEEKTVMAGVMFDDNRNVHLQYNNGYFKTLDVDEIKAALSHEACHIATLPNSAVIISQGSPPLMQWFQSSYVEVFDEFLAHKEFLRRFQGTTTFAQYDNLKEREFRNYEVILANARNGIMDPMKALYTILNDAIYFPAVGDQRFLKWCKHNTLENTSQFLDWLIEDFTLIAGLHINRIEMMETVIRAGILSLGVDPTVLLNLNRIVFVDSAMEAEEKISKKNKDIVELWRKRRLAA